MIWKDKDYIIDSLGNIFMVFGVHHTPSTATSLLKYIPSPDGKWIRRNRTYKRVLEHEADQIPQSINAARNIDPIYVGNLLPFNIEFTFVPVSRMVEYYRPEEKLSEILEAEHLKSVEYAVKEITFSLIDIADIRVEDIGVTGSILLDMFMPFSDIDITIYGISNVSKLINSIEEIYDSNSYISRVNLKDFENSIKRFARKCNIKFSEAKAYVERKKWLANYKDKRLSFMFVRKPNETKKFWNEKKYVSIGPIEITATVMDVSESLFNPSIISISDIVIIDRHYGIDSKEILRILFFETALSGYVYPDEKIRIRGLLQKVERTYDEFYQILIGSKELKHWDTIRLLEEAVKRADIAFFSDSG